MAEGVVFPFPSLPLNEGRTYGQPEVVLISLPQVLIQGGECAYAIEEKGSCWCAIEKAWSEGKCDFRKPISCHLYPILVTKYEGFEALNYNRWDICGCARLKGEQAGMPLYRFLKQALIARYGEEWYEQLEYAAREIEAGNIEIPPR